jgi:hypothetical protein
MNGHIRVDLAWLSRDALAVLRWISREERDRDDQDRVESDDEPLLGVDVDVIHAVARAIARRRAWLDPAEARCLRLLINAAGDRFGEADLKSVHALMKGDDERASWASQGMPDLEAEDDDEVFEELDALADRIKEAVGEAR